MARFTRHRSQVIAVAEQRLFDNSKGSLVVGTKCDGSPDRNIFRNAAKPPSVNDGLENYVMSAMCREGRIARPFF